MISVIIPVYNVEEYLEECVNSVINQSFKDIEIILVDDGSTDDSSAICERLMAVDSRIRVIHTVNSGVSSARNTGLDAARGEYIAFIDSDDYISTDYLEYLYGLISQNNASISVCDYIDDGEFVASHREIILYPDNKSSVAAFLQTNNIITTPWGKLFCKSTWEDVRFDLNNSCEDAATIYKAVLKADSVVVGFDKKYFYRMRQGSATHKPFAVKDIDHIKAMYDRAQVIGSMYPELITDANNYIIYAANQALIKMAAEKMYKSEYHEYLRGLYKEYGRDFKYGHSSRSSKFFAKVARVDINLAMRLYRLTDKSLMRRSIRSFIRDTASVIWGIKSDIRWAFTRKNSCLNKSDRSPRLIVSMTTYGERIGIVHKTIKTILSQKVRPDEVVLWLAASEFPGKEKDLPKSLTDLVPYGLKINWCDDIKSYKKLIYALRDYSKDIIVTADDDAFYSPGWLKKLYESYKDEPDSIHCHRATPFYVEDDKIKTIIDGKHFYKEASVLNMQVGCAGVLYPPCCFDSAIGDIDTFMSLTPTNDDLWFWAMAVKKGTKIKVVPGNIAIPIPTREASYTSKLTDINNKGEMLYDKQLKALLRAYPEVEEALRSSASKEKIV